MNEWQWVHDQLGLPPPALLLLLHSLVEQALLGHSIVHHEHSAVMSKGNSFRHMEFMSKCNACILLLITYVLDERYWMGPNQGYQKFWWILFFQKNCNTSWINTLRKPNNNNWFNSILIFLVYILQNLLEKSNTRPKPFVFFFLKFTKRVNFSSNFLFYIENILLVFSSFFSLLKPQKISQISCPKKIIGPKMTTCNTWVWLGPYKWKSLLC